ncbi:hypothetical protein ES703_99321 [subsurface metagenome]
METIQAKIRSCYHLATTIRLLLHEALDQANDVDYDAHWIAAINRASQNNELVWLDTHNIATCIDPQAPLTRPEHP